MSPQASGKHHDTDSQNGFPFVLIIFGKRFGHGLFQKEPTAIGHDVRGIPEGKEKKEERGLRTRRVAAGGLQGCGLGGCWRRAAALSAGTRQGCHAVSCCPSLRRSPMSPPRRGRSGAQGSPRRRPPGLFPLVKSDAVSLGGVSGTAWGTGCARVAGRPAFRRPRTSSWTGSLAPLDAGRQAWSCPATWAARLWPATGPRRPRRPRPRPRGAPPSLGPAPRPAPPRPEEAPAPGA